MFRLHPQLAQDTYFIGDMPLSSLLLSKDANYPWCILVPRRESITEIHQLANEDRLQLLHESCVLAEVMEHLYKPDKMNMAALGNMVPQLHLHHIARFHDDVAWPKPIWGVEAPTGYPQTLLESRIEDLQQALVARGLIR